MEKKHILLEKANSYKIPSKLENVEGYYFNDAKGYWEDSNGGAMINNPKADAGQTKKCDIETGEDQKGE